jgi:hypothetical protein
MTKVRIIRCEGTRIDLIPDKRVRD